MYALKAKSIKGECEYLAAGLRSAVWNPDKVEDVRLDNGTSDIDILDAWEYAMTPHMGSVNKISQIQFESSGGK